MRIRSAFRSGGETGIRRTSKKVCNRRIVTHEQYYRIRRLWRQRLRGLLSLVGEGLEDATHFACADTSDPGPDGPLSNDDRKWLRFPVEHAATPPIVTRTDSLAGVRLAYWKKIFLIPPSAALHSAVST